MRAHLRIESSAQQRVQAPVAKRKCQVLESIFWKTSSDTIVKRFLPVFLLIAVAAAFPASADESDETLNYYLSKSECVASGTMVSEPIGISYEAGVVEYICDFKVSEVFKGVGMTNGTTTRVAIVRFEQGTPDRNPLIKKGAACILFLKDSSRGIPKWRTADFWFGIQPFSSTLARSLRRLAQKP